MATYARETLIQRALQELGIVDANEAPEAADAATANDHAQQLLEMLYEDGLIPFDVDTDEIPARYFLPLVSKLAFRMVATFGVVSRADFLGQGDVGADRRLNRLRQAADVESTTQATYF